MIVPVGGSEFATPAIVAVKVIGAETRSLYIPLRTVVLFVGQLRPAERHVDIDAVPDDFAAVDAHERTGHLAVTHDLVPPLAFRFLLASANLAGDAKEVIK